jgi:hypothetical protein
MAGRADVVFCLDVSGSMSPTIRGVCEHLRSFVSGLSNGGQTKWDVRLGLLTHRAEENLFDFAGLEGQSVVPELYGQRSPGGLFTPDPEVFCQALRATTATGDEATLIALDSALDFPWRAADKCRRIVILMTDEAIETGVHVRDQVAQLPSLIQKIQALRVSLFIVAPPSEILTKLSTVDRSEYIEVDSVGNGLSSVDFSEVLTSIGKSVSVSQSEGIAASSIRRALYGQDKWRTTDQSVRAGG